MSKIKNIVPPVECVTWFEENFMVGDKVKFTYNGGLGGTYPIKGIITKIDSPIITIDSKEMTFLMGDILTISKI